MNVKRNPIAEERRLEQTRMALVAHKLIPGIHVTDLLSPRKAYWERIVPRETSDRETMLYFIGRTQHSMLLGEGDLSRSDTGPTLHPDLGIVYSPDQVDSEGNPIELKTTRAQYPPHEDDDGYVRDHGELKEYLQQLAIYCVLMDKRQGQLVILYLNLKGADRRTEPAYRVYDVKLTEQDVYRIREQISTTKAQIEEAVATQTEWLAPACESWKCFACRWADICSDASER